MIIEFFVVIHKYLDGAVNVQEHWFGESLGKGTSYQR